MISGLVSGRRRTISNASMATQLPWLSARHMLFPLLSGEALCYLLELEKKISMLLLLRRCTGLADHDSYIL